MCGIVGKCSCHPISNAADLLAQRDTMHHRGPDDAGVWWSEDRRVGLAHRRLAIIDLSPAGHQPMSDQSGRLCIVLNGEIYNFKDLRAELEAKGYRFCSAGDTEVVLASYQAWGVACVQHLNGMFAFGLYDGQRHRLFLARDRAGEKPLFYRVTGQDLRFASTLNALMADNTLDRRLNPEAFAYYLAFGYVPGNRCILQGTSKLPPAHCLTFDLDTGSSKLWRYWQLPHAPPDDGPPDATQQQALLEETERLLEDAVRRQLVADVTVGVLLSGGVDSSLVTAMAVRSSPHVKTFTVRFSGYNKYDEAEHARLIARHFGTEHLEIEANAVSVDLLPLLAGQYDEPIADSSMIPMYLVSKMVRQHCTVALAGDGGDELFGGYPYYARLLSLGNLAARFPAGLRNVAAGLATVALPLGWKGRYWLQALAADLETELPTTGIFFDALARSRLLRTPWGKQIGSGSGSEALRSQGIPRESDLLQRALRMDFANYLPEDLLVKVDRASMLHSLEVRAPLLDYRMIEFAFGRVPSSLKVTGSRKKVLLKQLAARVLPPAFDVHRKQGFAIPLSAWLQDREWGTCFRHVLLDSGDGVFEPRYVAGLLDRQARGWNSERLFALVLFELWRQEHKVTL